MPWANSASTLLRPNRVAERSSRERGSVTRRPAGISGPDEQRAAASGVQYRQGRTIPVPVVFLHGFPELLDCLAAIVPVGELQKHQVGLRPWETGKGERTHEGIREFQVLIGRNKRLYNEPRQDFVFYRFGDLELFRVQRRVDDIFDERLGPALRTGFVERLTDGFRRPGQRRSAHGLGAEFPVFPVCAALGRGAVVQIERERCGYGDLSFMGAIVIFEQARVREFVALERVIATGEQGSQPSIRRIGTGDGPQKRSPERAGCR